MPAVKTTHGRTFRFPKRTRVKGMKMRSRVLHDALVLEGFSNYLLGKVLNLQKGTESRVLGNRSGTLSFNQRIWFLIELGLLREDCFPKFQMFMELRNQVAHNSNASTFTACFEAMDKTNVLLKWYPQDRKLTIERQLSKAVRQLSSYVLDKANELVVAAVERMASDIERDVLSKQDAFNALLESIEGVIVHTANEIKKRHARKKYMTPEEVEELPLFIWKQVHRAFKMHIKNKKNQKTAVGE